MNEEDHRQWWREARFGMFIHWGLYYPWCEPRFCIRADGANFALPPEEPCDETASPDG